MFYGDENNPKQPEDSGTYRDPNDISSQPDDQAASSSSQNGRTPDYTPYGGNVQYKWNYDDYQKALDSSHKKGKKKGLTTFVITICSVFGVAVIGLAAFGIYSISKNGISGGLVAGLSNSSTSSTMTTGKVNNSGPTLNIVSQPGTPSTTTLAGGLSVQQCAKKVLPSVVGIIDYSLNQIGETGEGSGIIMSSNGYIITNNHVVTGADKFQVVLQNGTKYAATLVGTDARTDLAVLKFSATGLTAATFGDSSQLEVGDPVIAIGNPGGLELAETVTQGIISALNRTITTDTGYNMTYLQTDASINPGNSGGALVNMYGQIVGINAAKISDVDYEGIGFSIPIDVAKPVIDSITKYGYVKDRVKLGISCQVFDEYQAKLYNLPQGLLITAVDPSSNAAKKGLQKNDIITKVNGKSVTAFSDLLTEESKYKVGQTITLTICRATNGTAQTFTVAVSLMEDRGNTTPTTTSPNSQSDGQNSESNFFDFP
ncbi:MAG: trypsin-like peptidase domain-containing protein [Clostridia bacterium]|nr:trypsin-like peptidase domain-containing protein [Clostridia bacterium]